jgi:hypothetical protein
MAITTLVKQGCFDADLEKQINDNFASLSASTAGGTLTSAHLLVGNSSNVATDRAITGDLSISNTGVTTVASVNGVKFASGITALDGSNPTTVATGLASITGLALTLNRSSSLASGTAFVTYNNISGGSFDMYGWVVAGTASSGTDNIAWVAIGT